MVSAHRSEALYERALKEAQAAWSCCDDMRLAVVCDHFGIFTEAGPPQGHQWEEFYYAGKRELARDPDTKERLERYYTRKW